MEYTNGAYLVEAGWLEENLHQKNLRIFDVTGMLTGKLENLAEQKHFNKGHIPGATFLDVASAKGVLSDPANPLPWMCPQKEQFEQLGFKPGDLITGVNGIPLDDPANTVRLYQTMRAASEAVFDLERENQQLTVSVSLDGGATQ